jgi:chromate reductase
MPRDIAVIVGSLRKGSLNRLTAQALAALAPESLRLEIVGIGQLPLYDQDMEADPPSSWTEFRERVGRADGVLFVTPEYNRSVPGALKNAIDVGSRPYGHSVWSGKPAAIASVSPGALGAFGANHHLRQSLVFLNVPLLSAEAYVGNAFALFDENGELINETTTEFLRSYGQQFSAWINKILGADGSVAKAA